MESFYSGRLVLVLDVKEQHCLEAANFGSKYGWVRLEFNSYNWMDLPLSSQGQQALQASISLLSINWDENWQHLFAQLFLNI